MQPITRRSALALMTTLMASTVVSRVNAQQTFPSRPIRLVSPFSPGGGTDFIARTMAKYIEQNKGWNFVVENKAGAGGTLGITDISRAEPSGYDLAIGQSDNLILAPLLTKVSYDPATAFTPIALVGRSPLVVLVSSKSPYKTFDDLLAAAKAAPGTVTFGSSGVGSSSHLAYELVRLHSGIVMKHVPYRGSTLALTDVVGGHVISVGTSIASAIGLIRDGEVRPLAVTGAKRSPTLPDVPTIAELGTPDVDMSTWYGVIGPKGMAADIVDVLNGACNQVLAEPAAISAFKEQGLQVEPGTPEAFNALLQKDIARWTELMPKLDVKRG